MNVSIALQPVVNLPNRKSGTYGIGEVINLGVVVKPATATIASVGGIGFRIAAGKGTISNANTAAGTATFTAPATAGDVRIAAYGLNDSSKELGSSGIKVVAPTSLSFKKQGNVIHTHGSADAGFHGEIRLQPPGVSYQQLRVREGEFKGTGSGYYAAQQGLLHPATAAPVDIVDGNRVNGIDSIYSGIQGVSWSEGKFQWNIPWQYQVIGTTNWVTFAFANHVQQINALGVVTIGKFDAGPYSAKPSDPTSN